MNMKQSISMRLLVLLLLIASSHAFMGVFDSLIVDEIFASLETQVEEGDNASTEFVESYIHIVDALLITVTAWIVVVVTLEVNDFSHHLMLAYDDASHSDENSRRYISSLKAIQYGMFDAVIDWSIVYTIAYAVIGGLTWYYADINFLTVIWGFSLMFCALFLAVAGLKIPAWLGHYRVSKIKTISDTSGFAADAVEGSFDEGSSIIALRYQARLGVGKHFAQFFWLLLPFYTNLKFWWYLLSIAIGFAIGQLFIFIVFKCRQRFTKRREFVAFGASAVVAIGSSAAFTRGVQIVNIGWDIGHGKSHIILPIAFFVWLIIIGLFHGLKYFEHRRFETDLFASTVHEAEREEFVEDALSEPLLEESLDRREFMKKDSLASRVGFYYQTAYFNRINLSHSSATPLTSGSDDDVKNREAKITPRQVYKSFADLEESEAGVKWYHRIWRFLPLKAMWSLFVVGTLDTCRCCARKDMSCGKKTWFILRKIVKLLINIACAFLAFVACYDAHDTSITMAKLPYVESIYRGMNEWPVCAYDTKCGDIKTFDSKEAAHDANYYVAHCGNCSGCSTWQDLSVQWTTKDKAAKLAQRCGILNLFDRDGMAQCLRDRFGWTTECSYAWVHSVECAREECMGIVIRTAITNRLLNFQMSSITPAKCNEAQCEQGNPGYFAKLSGASRRKMNIRSSIARSPDQQCQIVDNIPRDSDGFNDWGPFFKELCPRSDSPP